MFHKLTITVIIIAFYNQVVDASEQGDAALFSVKIRFRLDDSKKNMRVIYADCLIVNQGENLVGIGGFDLFWDLDGTIGDFLTVAGGDGADIDKTWPLKGHRGKPELYTLLEPIPKSRDELESECHGAAYVEGSSVLVSLPISNIDDLLTTIIRESSKADAAGYLKINLSCWILTANNDSHKMKAVMTGFEKKIHLSKIAWNKWFTLHVPVPVQQKLTTDKKENDFPAGGTDER